MVASQPRNLLISLTATPCDLSGLFGWSVGWMVVAAVVEDDGAPDLRGVGHTQS